MHRSALLVLAVAALTAGTVAVPAAAVPPSTAAAASGVATIGPDGPRGGGPMTLADRRVALRRAFAAGGVPAGGGTRAFPGTDPRLVVTSAEGTSVTAALRPDGTVSADPPLTGSPLTLAVASPSGESLLTRGAPAGGGRRSAELRQVEAAADPVALDPGVGPQLWTPAGDARLHQPSPGVWELQSLTSPGERSVLDVPADVEPTSVSTWGDVAYGLRTTASGTDVAAVPVPGVRGVRAAAVATTDLGLSAWAPGRPTSAMAATSSVYADDPTELLAFAGTVPGTSERRLVLVTRAGREATWGPPVALGAIGATCDVAAPAFDESRTRLAYLVATGPAGDECSAFEVRVLLAGADSRFSASDTDVLAATWPASRGLPRTLTFVAGAAAVPSMRMAGANRVDVAVATSRRFVPAGTARGVVVTGAQAQPDALTGGPLAAQLDGSSLLTPTTRLPDTVLAEIRRALDPRGTVYIVGGPAAVAPAVETRLRDEGLVVERITGANRFTVAVEVAREEARLRGSAPATAFVTSGRAFADALVAGPAAFASGAPVLLSDGGTLPYVTRAYLQELGPQATVYAVGGSSVAALAGDQRARGVSGANRYLTAVAVAERFFPAVDVLTVVDGRNWPDAASAGALTARWGQPIVLANSRAALDPTAAYVTGVRQGVDYQVVLGGTTAVPDAAAERYAGLAGAQGPYGQWVR
ncbi:cell wall-binding repeat-containing protein [Phycicoccus flavus]|uniref:cell wall-binding repeat-containing protein n=1 Tax=Phycicoccus flavus TaxID=2502783 RepID=UPI000FEBE951|nr:cell wall-binding repeat-containing protein [Phycicoccus flavus]NHA69224.1 hypothetical protein [Phycicoccus flavus]